MRQPSSPRSRKQKSSASQRPTSRPPCAACSPPAKSKSNPMVHPPGAGPDWSGSRTKNDLHYSLHYPALLGCVRSPLYPGDRCTPVHLVVQPASPVLWRDVALWGEPPAAQRKNRLAVFFFAALFVL